MAGKPNTKLNYEFFSADFVAEYSDIKGICNLNDYISSICGEFISPSGCFFSKISPDQFYWLVRSGVIGGVLMHPVVISARRRNKIAQAVSMAIALQTDRWTSLHPSTDVEPHFDHDLIVGYARNVVTLEGELDLVFNTFNLRPVECIYEDFIADDTAFLREIEIATGIRIVKGGYKSTLPVEVQGTELNMTWEQRVRSRLRESLLKT